MSDTTTSKPRGRPRTRPLTVRPKRSCRTPIDAQVDLAKRLAVEYLRGNASTTMGGPRVISMTGEVYWQIRGETWIVAKWQSHMTDDAIEFAWRHLAPLNAGPVSSLAMADWLDTVDADMLAWCLARHKFARSP